MQSNTINSNIPFNQIKHALDMQENQTHNNRLSTLHQTTAQVISAAIKEKHKEINNLPFIKTLRKGEISADSYHPFLQSSLMLYQCLENNIRTHQNNTYIYQYYHIIIDKLERESAIKEDIQWHEAENAMPTRSTIKYTEYLNTLIEHNPMLFIVHIHLKYIADLFGGQLIKSKIENYAKKNDLPIPATNIFNFGLPEEIKAYRNALYQIINTLPVEESDLTLIQQDAEKSMQFFVDIFKELSQ